MQVKSDLKITKATILAILVTSLMLNFYGNNSTFAAPPSLPSTPHNFQLVISSFNKTQFMEDVRYLSSLARFTGYPGFFEAASYIASKFKEFGLTPYGNNPDYFEWFNITSPISYSSWIYTSDGLNATVYPLYPNLVNPSPYDSGNVYDTLVYVGKGSLEELSHINVTGKFVLMDFASGWNYLYALQLKAKGVIFVPESYDLVTRPESDQKLLFLPVYFPRLYLPLTESGKKILELCKNAGPKGIQVKIKSSMDWEVVRVPNIVGFLKGSDPALSNQIVVIAAYYDSFSVVPSLSYGATDALNVAELLQLANFLSQYRPKRSILFVALAGHYQALWGAREFVYKHFDELQGKIISFVSFDLSSDSEQIGVYAIGSSYTYHYSTILLQRYTWLSSKFFGSYLPEMKMVLGVDYGDTFVDGILGSHPPSLVMSPTFEPYQYGYFSTSSVFPTIPLYLYRMGTMYDSDPFVLVMYGGGFTFHTTNAFRLYQRSPNDIYKNINFTKVWPQVFFAHCSLWAFLNEPEVKLITSKSKFSDDWGYVTLNVTVTTYNMLTAYFDPINYTRYPELKDKLLVYVSSGGLQIIAKVSEGSSVIIHGLKPYLGGTVEAFAVDKGKVIWTTDVGAFAAPGGKGIPLSSQNYTKIISIFPCASIFVPLAIQPNNFRTLPVSVVNDARAHSIAVRHNVMTLDTFYMAFVEPNIPSEVVLSLGGGLPSLILNNASYAYPNGKGYLLNQGEQLIISPIDVLQNMYTISQSRYTVLREKYAIMPITDYYYRISSNTTNLAFRYFEEGKISSFFGYSLIGLGLVVQWYNYVMGLLSQVTTSMDVVFLISLIFSLILGQLLFEEGKRRLVTTALIFVASNTLLYLLHPSYAISTSWVLTLLSTMVLLIVLTLIIMTLEEAFSSMKAKREELLGKHSVEISRAGFVDSAINLALGNIKKRKLRSGLTMLSLTAIIFGTITLASVSMFPALISQKVSAQSSYNGAEVRATPWSPLNLYVSDALSSSFKEEAYTSPRAFLYPPPVPSFVVVEAGTSAGLQYISFSPLLKTQVYAILALSPEEANVTNIDKLIVSGRWFNKDDVFSTVLTQSLAESLSDELGERIQVNSTISLWGINLRVVGIIDDKVENVTNPDGESIMPLDPTSPIEFPSHLRAKNVLIIPFSLFKEIVYPATVANIAIKPIKPEKITEIRELVPYTLVYSLYISSGYNQSEALLTRQWVSIEGIGFLVIPSIISSMIILDVMLASVYERRREILIYNATGMAPLHISINFITEALTYGAISIFIGYVGGILTTSILIKLGLYPKELYPNFSSLSILVILLLSLAIIIASSLYPSSLAGRLAIPSLAIRWTRREKGPAGDIWKVSLPLVLKSKDDARAFLSYMREFLASPAKGEGLFYVEDIKLVEKQEGNSQVLSLNASCRFAPLDMGIKSNVIIETRREEGSSQYFSNAIIERVSGYAEAWKLRAVLVMDSIRKQIISWRSLPPEERLKYRERGDQL